MKRGLGCAIVIAIALCGVAIHAAWADAAGDSASARPAKTAADSVAATPVLKPAAKPATPAAGAAHARAPVSKGKTDKPASPHNWNAPHIPTPPSPDDSDRVKLPRLPVKTVVSRTSAGRTSKVSYFTVEVTHRVFGAFHMTERARMRTEFRIGDTEYSSRAIAFEPDFTMGLQSGRVFSRSPEPRNPAVQLVVRQKGVPQDTVWAFLNSPPHFGRKSLLSFKLVRVEFLDHPAIPAPDSAAARGKTP